jgi:hypothetical protein
MPHSPLLSMKEPPNFDSIPCRSSKSHRRGGCPLIPTRNQGIGLDESRGLSVAILNPILTRLNGIRFQGLFQIPLAVKES